VEGGGRDDASIGVGLRWYRYRPMPILLRGVAYIRVYFCLFCC